MKKDISATKMASCLLGIGLMLTGYSCTDSNFDLSDIDTTIGIGGDSLAMAQWKNTGEFFLVS